MKAKQQKLFEVQQDSPTHKQRIDAFKKANDIETHNCGAVDPEPWSACHMPTAKKIREPYRNSKENDLGAIVADVCRLLDEAGVLVCGKTEREAIKQLCRNLEIPCDL